MTPEKLKRPVFEPVRIRNISVAVYRKRLVQDSGPGADERMMAKDADGGLKLRSRAAMYDPLTRAYLDVLGIKP